MSASSLTIRHLRAYDYLISNGPHVQCVRWKQKPIWLPTAKSKLYRIPKVPVIPQEEVEELKRIHNYYRTHMTSLRSHFIRMESANRIKFDPVTVRALAAKDFDKCNEINEQWNKEVAEEREQRLAKQREVRIKEIMLKLEAKRERDLELRSRVDAEIKKAKEEASTFITPENIDKAIENALKNIVNHNVAIDINGNFYTDDYTEVSQTTESAENAM
ncbi:mitochondrial ribosomal protein S26 [Andrena cerasifolii]|uniref:mitochondrial ribosomal protein S26 n=1 Tax=Andrena cerasifolii TaxID=2819439 RepID=UPI0040379812